MSKITITPNGAGTGTFSIASPNSNTNRTLTLPDSTGELLNAESSLNATKLTGNIAASQLTGALPAISGASLTGIDTESFKPAYIGGATYVVTVASVGGVNKFHIAGVANPTLSFLKGNAYVFDLSDSSNAGHPLVFKTGSDAAYTTGVVVTGTAGQAGAKVTITVAASAPAALLYSCSVHGNAMGNTIAVAVGGVLNVGTFNFFDNGTLAANTTVSFSSVPTNAKWSYSFKADNLDKFNTSAISYVQSFSVGDRESNPNGVFFKSDGMKMYVIGSTGDDVNEYLLSEAWNISTANYSANVSVAARETTPTDIFFKPDGARMFIIGTQADTVFRYNLSPAWSVSGASYQESFPFSSQDTSPQGIFFKEDGLKMYMVGSQNDSVYQYTLSSAWNTQTASYDSVSFSVATQDTFPKGVRFKSDGTEMYILGGIGKVILQYTLSTAWDISSASLTSTSASTVADNSEPMGIFLKPDGQRLFIIGKGTDFEVNEYTIGTPSTATLPAAVQNTPSGTLTDGARVTYDFFTLDGGTTVTLIGEEIV